MKKYLKQAGGIVLNNFDQVLMVKALSQKWTFPKGSLLKDEDRLSAAKREIKEETGVFELDMIRELGSYERLGFTKENLQTPTVIKNITYYLFRTDQTNLVINDEGTIAAKWVKIEKISENLSYKEDKRFFNTIKKYLDS